MSSKFKVLTFDELLAKHGKGMAANCKQVSILASVWNQPILEHAKLQDSNDRFLANIQQDGPFRSCQESRQITPDKLIVLGEVAKKYTYIPR